MTMEPALLEKKGHIALITLNRPEARNSFSPVPPAKIYDQGLSN